MKTAFRYLALIDFVFVVAAVGGIEHGSIGIVPGGIAAFAFLALAAIFAGLGGMYYHR